MLSWIIADSTALQEQIGGMVELVDTLDSKSGIFGCGGSSPPPATIYVKAFIER